VSGCQRANGRNLSLRVQGADSYTTTAAFNLDATLSTQIGGRGTGKSASWRDHHCGGDSCWLCRAVGLGHAAGAGPRLVWAVEGCRSPGAGLLRVLVGAGQEVVEAGRPQRATRRPGGKSDPADAHLAARTVLAAGHHTLPRRNGGREALRILLVARDHATTPARQRSTCSTPCC
jgi:hypothetical protein